MPPRRLALALAPDGLGLAPTLGIAGARRR